MRSQTIHFGTSGWRGAIGCDFAFSGARDEFAGRRVEHTHRSDGLKLILDDDKRLLMRPSGTELVARVYTEAAALAASRQLAEAARAWIVQ